MSIAEKLVNISEKIQRVFELKDNKPYLDTSKIIDFRYFNQEGKRDFIFPFLDTSNGTNFFYFCKDAKNLVTVDLDFSKATQCTEAFRNCSALETVVYLDLSSIPQGSGNLSAIFSSCSALKNITMKPNCLKANISFAACSLLTDESIQSIIDGLASNVGARKISLHADVYAKLTEEQFTIIASKGWEVVSV